jgi:hypothetical protein
VLDYVTAEGKRHFRIGVSEAIAEAPLVIEAVAAIEPRKRDFSRRLSQGTVGGENAGEQNQVLFHELTYFISGSLMLSLHGHLERDGLKNSVMTANADRALPDRLARLVLKQNAN